MEWIINTIYYVVPFLIILGILVFVHELGHFLMARFLGVKVDEFSLGFGKELWGFTDKAGTRWKLSAIPLGGYCKFFGDADASSSTNDDEKLQELSDEDKKVTFALQHPVKKLWIVLAGPLTNYLFAILIFASIFYFMGKINFPPVIGGIMPNSAAEQVGLQVNDKVLSINGASIKHFSDIRKEVELTTDGQVDVELLRGEEVISLNFPLKAVEVVDNTGAKSSHMMLGITSLNAVEIEKGDTSVVTALKEATVECWELTTTTLRGLGQMVTGKRSGEEIGGIIRIAEMSGDITKQYGLLNLFVFMAILSVNLGLINLFPIPVLDGGHVVIYVVEMIFGRELNEKLKENMFKFGLSFILLLMVYATWNDFVRLFNRWFS